MIKFVTVAAFAALVAAPAMAEEIRVPVSGKTQEQLQADIRYAARQVCFKEISTETMQLSAFTRCMKGTLESTQPQLARLSLR
ncbi:MAG TPA: hypothetical protein VIO94_00315 [Phenylobacterium sp.]